MPSRMVGRLLTTVMIATTAIGTTAYAVHQALLAGVQPDGRILIPNGQTLTPAGTHLQVNDRPLGMVVSPDGTLLAVVTGSNFNPRALHIIDLQTRTLKQTLAIANSFVGVAFNPAGDTLYVGGGPSNDVKIFKATSGVFAVAGTIPISGGAIAVLGLSTAATWTATAERGGRDGRFSDFLNFAAPAGNRPATTDTVVNGVRAAVLPNGRLVAPAGVEVNVQAPKPFGMALSPDGGTLATLNSGAGPFSLTLITQLASPVRTSRAGPIHGRATRPARAPSESLANSCKERLSSEDGHATFV